MARSEGAQAWQREMTTRIGTAVRKLRDKRDISRDALVAALGALGVTITRQALVNLEVGRRDALTLGEWFGLAAVLDVPPGALLYSDPAADATVLPTRPPLPGYIALDWIVGERTRIPWDLLSEGTEDAENRYADAGAAIRACRDHDVLVFDAMLADIDGDRDRYRDTVIALAARRDEMHRRGWTLPDLPDDVARGVAVAGQLQPPRRSPTDSVTANHKEN